MPEQKGHGRAEPAGDAEKFSATELHFRIVEVSIDLLKEIGDFSGNDIRESLIGTCDNDCKQRCVIFQGAILNVKYLTWLARHRGQAGILPQEK